MRSLRVPRMSVKEKQQSKNICILTTSNSILPAPMLLRNWNNLLDFPADLLQDSCFGSRQQDRARVLVHLKSNQLMAILRSSNRKLFAICDGARQIKSKNRKDFKLSLLFGLYLPCTLSGSHTLSLIPMHIHWLSCALTDSHTPSLTPMRSQ